MYTAEYGSTASARTSRFHGLEAGNTWQPPTTGGRMPRASRVIRTSDRVQGEHAPPRQARTRNA